MRSLWEKKGRDFVELDIAILANGKPVAHVLHSAIYRLPAPRLTRARGALVAPPALSHPGGRDRNFPPRGGGHGSELRARGSRVPSSHAPWFEANTPAVEPKTLAERKAWHRTMYDAGYVGMLWPKEYGGRGATPMQQAIVQDEMARASAPPPINGLGIGFIGPTIIVHGTEAQKKRYLQKMLTAEEIWCQLYSEPNAGSDLAGLKTRAEDAGDHFVVNGQKIWTSSGPIADWGILLARTDSKVAKHKGISCFLFSMRQPGVEVRPLKQITGSALFSEVFMTNARA